MNATQRAFREDRSCQTNLLSSFEEIPDSADKGNSVDVIHPDFWKVFGLVPPDILSKKLAPFKMNTAHMNWIKNRLPDWLQHRTVNAESSPSGCF